MKSVTQCLGENVKRLRNERGGTQSQFAEQAGLSLSFVQNIEAGKKWVGPETIAVLAQTLKVSESELFKDCEREPHPDAKAILAVMCAALGVEMPEETLENLEIRRPFSHYSKLYELIPDDICLELTNACEHPEWDWAVIRKTIAGYNKPK